MATRQSGSWKLSPAEASAENHWLLAIGHCPLAIFRKLPVNNSQLSIANVQMLPSWNRRGGCAHQRF